MSRIANMTMIFLPGTFVCVSVEVCCIGPHQTADCFHRPSSPWFSLAVG